MKNIPIVILNKDRLNPLRMLVDALHKRNYENIIIIDNESSYQPLLDWYKTSRVKVFHNTFNETLFDTGTFYRLAMEMRYPPFVDIVRGHYVFTDSDVVPDDCVPADFIEHMIEVCNEFSVHKVGLSLRIDDLPNTESGRLFYNMEKGYWENTIPHSKYTLYRAGVDTTFALYHPNSPPLLNMNVIRMGGNYIARHLPWYYDINNLPDDEMYYLQKLKPNRGPTHSMKVKERLEDMGKL